MTSNVGISTFEKNPVGFGTVQVSDVDDKAIKQLFRPEFRNRLDATVRFGRLKPENMLQIVDKFLAELNQLCSARNVELVVEQSAKDWLATEGYDPMMGARPLARVIAEKIKTPLSKIMVTGGLKHGGKAVVCYKNNAITIENEFGTVY
jgi:ATP-dependent Clp protease ATP-binding subunit ClpA